MSDNCDDSIDSTKGVDDDDKLNRNRERNKEHARKTRIRKKEQLDFLKSRVTELEENGHRLRQRIEDCNVASILIGLSSGDGMSARDEHLSSDGAVSSSAKSPTFSGTLSEGKRKRFSSLDGGDPTPPPMELNIKGQVTLVGGSGNNGKTQMNWKTGVYFDVGGKRQQLTIAELKSLRRERNRMHAKMTRDRKKCFVASIKRIISKLEEDNQGLRNLLESSREETNNTGLNVETPDETTLEGCVEKNQGDSKKEALKSDTRSTQHDPRDRSTKITSISNSTMMMIG